MVKIVILRGLPGAGKTTWAKQLLEAQPFIYKRVCKDDLREMLDGGRWSEGNENFVLKTRDSLILQALNNGYSVLVDDTNLDPKHESQIREKVKEWNKEQEVNGRKQRASIEVKFFDIELEECIKRDRTREKPVGEKVIRDMYNRYLKPSVEKTDKISLIPIDPNLPFAVICDMDGTLALRSGRGPYDTSLYETDVVNYTIKGLLDILNNQLSTYSKAEIILVSGREDKFRAVTEKWLSTNGVLFDLFFMRPSDDKRQDAVIKKEIYENHIKGKYNILFVLDDRLRVCRMWYNLGLPLFRVGDPDADF